MKTLSRYSVLACLALQLGNVGCGDSKKKPEVANVAQDTMLLHDLAEANKNTAAAAAAVSLFASARSWRSMVSCATLATSGFFFESPQPTLPSCRARQARTEYLERVFIFFLS